MAKAIDSSNLGSQDSVNEVKCTFRNGLAIKVDYAEALRGHQSAFDEMRKSRSRQTRHAYRGGRGSGTHCDPRRSLSRVVRARKEAGPPRRDDHGAGRAIGAGSSDGREGGSAG